MKLFIIFFTSLVSFSASANDLRSIDCRGGSSLSRDDFLNTIDQLDIGESDPEFETFYIYSSGRPPESYPSGIYVLAENTDRFSRAKALTDHSMSLAPRALTKLSEDSSIMDRYRKSCPLDESSDEEVLSRGVEVMQWVAHFNDGSVMTTDYFTSLRPEAVVNIDHQKLNSFLQSVQEANNFNNFDHIEILHNHILPDTLSFIDIEYASTVSFEIKSRVVITAIVKDKNRLIEVRSATYNKGKRE